MSGPERDRHLLERAAEQDQAAIAELYDRYADLLHSLAVRIVGPGQEAEEVLRDAWVQAWRTASSHDPARGSVTAWLVTIARDRALDRVRTVSSRRRAEAAGAVEAVAEPSATAADPATGYQRRMLRKSVTAAVTSLAPPQRQVIELAYLDGLSQSEIATRLRAPVGTVKSWTRQALLRLRERVPLEELP